MEKVCQSEAPIIEAVQMQHIHILDDAIEVQITLILKGKYIVSVYITDS